jgi:hypothetical protein
VNKIFRNTACFSLWLSGFVIIAHLVIPHDHHSDCSLPVNQESCHSGNIEHPEKTHSFPFHCHALNELTFERTSFNIAIFNDIPTCQLFISDFIESTGSTTTLSYLKILDSQKPFIEADLLLLAPYRAPPTLS